MSSVGRMRPRQSPLESRGVHRTLCARVRRQARGAPRVDLLWPALVAVGVEQVRIDPGNTAFTPLDFVSYPYSHSLLTLALWGALFAWAFRASARPRSALLFAALVVSHWVLDFVTHRPDMPLYPGGPKVGLDLWASVPATVVIETIMFVAGVWMYASCTRARDRVGTWGFVGLVTLLAVLYVGNLLSPPPPSVDTLVVTAIIGAGVLIVLTWWADRHRESTCLTR
jgi:membrane-bound metal-dependent hydrolase YbcI (DUF457 family)